MAKIVPGQRIYALSGVDGRSIKVGISTDPDRRCAGLHLADAVLFTTEVRDDALRVERICHCLLVDRQDHGEWFFISKDEAVSTILRAIRIADGDEDDVTFGIKFSAGKRPAPKEDGPVTDYPYRKTIGFSSDLFKLLKRAQELTGNSLAFLVRKYVGEGCRREIAEAKRKTTQE